MEGGYASISFFNSLRKKILSEPEKAPPPSTAKGFFNDLKKKGSAMNIFSGLTSSNTSSPHDVMDPFEHSETYSRRVEGGKLTASVKSSNDAPSSDLPSAVGGGIGGDETDLGKSNRGHISLGKDQSPSIPTSFYFPLLPCPSHFPLPSLPCPPSSPSLFCPSHFPLPSLPCPSHSPSVFCPSLPVCSYPSLLMQNSLILKRHPISSVRFTLPRSFVS